MTEPICKVADIIYVRFELTEFEEQKKYFDHFGLMLAYEDENSIFLEELGLRLMHMLQLKAMKINTLEQHIRLMITLT